MFTIDLLTVSRFTPVVCSAQIKANLGSEMAGGTVMQFLCMLSCVWGFLQVEN